MPGIAQASRCTDRAGGIVSRSEDDYIGSRKIFETIQILEPSRCPIVLFQVFDIKNCKNSLNSIGKWIIAVVDLPHQLRRFEALERSLGKPIRPFRGLK